MVTSIAMMMTIMTMITMMNGWKQARCVCRTEQSSSVSALSQLWSESPQWSWWLCFWSNVCQIEQSSGFSAGQQVNSSAGYVLACDHHCDHYPDHHHDHHPDHHPDHHRWRSNIWQTKLKSHFFSFSQSKALTAVPRGDSTKCSGSDSFFSPHKLIKGEKVTAKCHYD